MAHQAIRPTVEAGAREPNERQRKPHRARRSDGESASIRVEVMVRREVFVASPGFVGAATHGETPTPQGFVWLRKKAWPNDQQFCVSRKELLDLLHDALLSGAGMTGRINLHSTWPPDPNGRASDE